MPNSPKDDTAAAGTNSQRYNDRQTNLMELCRRPLRRAVPKPPGDAAAKSARLRGKGVPPPSAKEWEYHPSKHFIPGKSFSCNLSGPDLQTAPPPSPRTVIRLSDRAYVAHLAGGAASVALPPKAPKPLRRPGTTGPRTARVLGLPTEDAEPVAQPTYALLGTARRDLFVTSRPTTAPSCVLLTKKQTRAGYEKGRSAYDDVFQYRHSGGICPREFKLVADRPTAPQLSVPSTNQARTNFFDSRSSYEFNKARARMSDVI